MAHTISICFLEQSNAAADISSLVDEAEASAQTAQRNVVIRTVTIKEGSVQSIRLGTLLASLNVALCKGGMGHPFSIFNVY